MLKRCACGASHAALPEGARWSKDWAAWFFVCACGSTLLVIPDLDETKRRIRAALYQKDLKP